MCYQVRDSASQPWQLWHGEIAGFNFQPGMRYRLRVVEVEDPNPPADPSGLRWVLDRGVEQKIVRRGPGGQRTRMPGLAPGNGSST